MSDIKTWHQRAMAHPDHQSGMISEDMIRARMCEEIDDLRAEVERLRAPAEKHPLTVRSAARIRQPLNGADAQALEGALAMTERERDAARAEVERLRADNDELYRAAGRTRAALSGWILASPDREDEPTHALVAAVVAEVERLGAALTSIASNTCCNGCQEAARVARAALEGEP